MKIIVVKDGNCVAALDHDAKVAASVSKEAHLVEGAQKSWRRLDGQNQLRKFIANVKFEDGIEASSPQPKAAA